MGTVDINDNISFFYFTQTSSTKAKKDKIKTFRRSI